MDPHDRAYYLGAAGLALAGAAGLTLASSPGAAGLAEQLEGLAVTLLADLGLCGQAAAAAVEHAPPPPPPPPPPQTPPARPGMRPPRR